MDFEPTWEDLKRYDDENRALRAEVERLRAELENERANGPTAREWAESRAEVERLKAALLESREAHREATRERDVHHREETILRAEVELLRAVRDEYRADIKNGMRIAWALTQETQTVEDMATDLVRQVREARQQRDEARADYERARADFLRCVETQRAAFADAATDADLLRAEAARLREALEGLAGDTPGPDSRPCWCHESDCACRNRAWCVAAREALKGGGK